MATLKDYFNNNVAQLLAFTMVHKTLYLIETGTGLGESIKFAKDCFRMNYTIEVMPEIYEKAKIELGSETNVMLICNDSKRGLKQILESDKVLHTEPILFFLDAHFPGADFGLADYDAGYDDDLRIPLKQELETISRLRGDYLKNDVFIIDDLRIYEEGPFEAGNWEHRDKLGGKGIDFVYDLFAETHYIEKDYRYQGFIILKPIK